MSTFLVKLADEKKLGLDNKLPKWRAEFARTECINPGQLTQTTPDYRDHTPSTAAVFFPYGTTRRIVHVNPQRFVDL
ncbi:hypothetical protein [Mycobacterium sp.]|uniref:hypothetical protein n=1 Tax=Mycobacterium sp. TaxID=1785 RepID=UPI003BAB8124